MVKVMWKEEVPKGTALIQQGDLQERHTTVKWPPELRFFLVFRGRLLLRRPVGQLSSFQDRERCQCREVRHCGNTIWNVQPLSESHDDPG